MKEEASRHAARLAHQCRVAALGTLRDGIPAVSQVPFALLPAADCTFVILVTRLAAHTRAMQEDPRFGLMIAQPENEHTIAHALARISFGAEAHMIARSHPDDDGARRLLRALPRSGVPVRPRRYRTLRTRAPDGPRRHGIRAGSFGHAGRAGGARLATMRPQVAITRATTTQSTCDDDLGPPTVGAVDGQIQKFSLATQFAGSGRPESTVVRKILLTA